MRLIIFTILILCFAVSGKVAAAETTIVRITPEKTFVLSDGREVVPVGIEIFEVPEEVLNVGVVIDGEQTDRYGRILGHMTLADGRWLQGVLLERGAARVMTTPDVRGRVAEMLEIESAARKVGQGIWADPAYVVKAPETVKLNRFDIVEGAILATFQSRRGTVYLNFGEDWKTDFTVTIEKAALKLFKDDPLDWFGRTIRVRGWVREYNGPLMDVTHPEQVEFID